MQRGNGSEAEGARVSQGMFGKRKGGKANGNETGNVAQRKGRRRGSEARIVGKGM